MRTASLLHLPCSRLFGLLFGTLFGILFLGAIDASAPEAHAAPSATPQETQPEVAAPLPFGPLPSPRQLAWHERQFYGFVHFGPNTFTGVEWGEGREDPLLFAPSALDCRQWAAAMKSAGMTGVILTAKHHDGFCLFDSAHTEHDVMQSATPRDVLKELCEACRALGLWVGVYLSPWDRTDPRYGSGEPYNEFFRAQLREVLSNYGPIAEVWFDGACGEGPDGRRQVYDWPSFIAVVRELQPDACIFSDAGPDVRWCGNERALGSATTWALLRRDEVYPGYPDYHELGPGHADGTHWVPYECNTSIRPGWFWKAGLDDGVKSLATLVDTWYASVGRAGNFLLNCPPDDRGRLPDVDVARLAELGAVLRRTFARDVLRAAVEAATVDYVASNVRGGDEARFGPIGLFDEDRATYWALDDGVTKGHLELRFESPITFDQVWLEEAIQLGQRITGWRVDAAFDGSWHRVAEGTTLGVRRILRTPRTTTDQLRLTIESALACPLVARLALFEGPSGGPARDAADGLASAVPPTIAPVQFIQAPERGYTWKRWDQRFQTVSQFCDPAAGGSAVPPAATGKTVTVDTAVASAGPCALVFEGHFYNDQPGLTEFVTESDDGSRVWVGDQLVVDNDGLHGVTRVAGRAILAMGYYPIRIAWFDAGGERALRFGRTWLGARD